MLTRAVDGGTIEYRRGEGGLLTNNTKELKQLNDNLFAMLHPLADGSAGGGRAITAPVVML